jgi:hypothetical protein
LLHSREVKATETLEAVPNKDNKEKNMKRQLLTLVGALALVLGSGSAFGQTIRVKINVPFDFIVTGKTLPAGEYAFRFNAGGSVLAVEGADTRETTMFLASENEDMKPAETTKLVFHHYAKRYFLRQVWMAGNYDEIELPKTRREIEVAMNYSSRDAILNAGLR